MVTGLIPSVLAAPAKAAEPQPSSPAVAAAIPSEPRPAEPVPFAAALTLPYTVDDLGDAPDTSPGDGNCRTAGGKCTLRAAIQEANARATTSAGDANVTIAFSVSGTIALGSPLHSALGAPSPTGNRSLTIDGCPSGGPCNSVRLDGGSSTQVLDLRADPITAEVLPSRFSATVAHITIAQGSAANGAGIYFRGETLTVDSVTFANNNATTSGGALYVYTGTVDVTNSTFYGNATTPGGSGGSVYVEDQADAPAAIVTLTNDTISTSDPAAALFAQGGNLFVNSSIIAGGSACTRGINGNLGGANNLTSDFAGCQGFATYNPSLGLTSFGAYGGLTQTIPPSPTSPAIGAGNASCPATDQRGLARPHAACDLGSAQFSGVTTTTLASSAPSVNYLAPVTFTAIVSATYGPFVPTGTVEFRDGSTVLATGVTLDGSGHAAYTTSTLGQGSHAITAVFTGTGSFGSSTSNTVTQQISTQIAQLSLSITAPRYVALGDTVTLTAYPRGGYVLPTSGTVIFSEGGSQIGSATVGGGSYATLDVVGLSWGPHSISALYLGGLYGNASAAPINVSVRQAPASTTATAAPASVVYGQPITLSVNVTGVSGGPSPTGSLSGTGGSCTAVVLGRASCTIGGRLDVGNAFLAVSYSGDDYYTPSYASTSATVTKAGTSLTVTPPSGPLTLGDDVTLVATLSPQSPSVLIPDVTDYRTNTAIDFSDGTRKIGTAYLTALGTATYTGKLAGGGKRTITASYAGDNNYLASGAPPITVTIGRAASTTTLIVGFPTEIPVGGTFTGIHAIVSFPPSVLVAQGGTVTFFDGTTVIGTASVGGNGEAWLFNYTPPGAGCDQGFVCSRTLSARYEGSDDVAPSTSAGVTVLVDRGRVLLTLLASQSTFQYGTSVTLTARVQPTYGSGTPTGTVLIFQPGRPTIGTVTLDAQGNATITTKDLYPSVKEVRAYYFGDDNFQASTEVSLALQIGLIPTTVTVTTTPSSPSAIGKQVQMLAKVTTGDGVAPGGTLTVSLNTTPQRVIPLGNGVDSGGFPLPSTDAGAYFVSASYSGDDSHAPSVATGYYHRIEQGALTLTFTSNVDAPSVGTPLTLTVSVAGLVAGLPPGALSITRTDKFNVTTTLATPKLDLSTGVATVALPAGLPVGTSHLIARINGNNTYQSASATLDVVVGRPVPQIVLNAGLAKVGQLMTVGVQVFGAGGPSGDIRYAGLGLPKPSGNITLDLNGPALQLTPSTTDYPLGFASQDWTPRAQGKQAIHAHYYGDDNYAEADLVMDVPVAGCKLSLASTLAGVTTKKVGDTVHAALTLTADNCGRPVAPNKPVTLRLGADQCVFGLYAASLTQTASCDILLKKAGTLTLTASYPGDDWFEPVKDNGTDVLFVQAGLLAGVDLGDWVVGDPVKVNWTVEGATTGAIFVSALGSSTGTCNNLPLSGSCTLTFGTPSSAMTITVTYRGTAGDVQTVNITKPILGCFPMTAQAGGFGKGTVTITPAPNCGTKYLEGTLVLFTATPDPHYSFANWNNETDLFGKLDTRYVTVKGRGEFEFANFAPICWKLFAAPERISDGLGDIRRSPSGNCPNVFGRDDMYFEGTVVTLTAVPATTIFAGPRAGQTGFYLDAWTGDASTSLGTTATVRMDGDRTVGAIFDWPCQTVTPAATPSDKGTLVVVQRPNCTARAVGGGPIRNGYRPGTTVRVTAHPLGNNFLTDLSFKGLPAPLPVVTTPSSDAFTDVNIVVPYEDVTAAAQFGSCVKLTLTVIKLYQGGRWPAKFIDPPTADPKGNCPITGLKDGWYLPNTVVSLTATYGNQNAVQAQATKDYQTELKSIADYYKNNPDSLKGDALFKAQQRDQNFARQDRQAEIDTDTATIIGWSDGKDGAVFKRTVTLGTTDMTLEAQYGSPGRCIFVPRRVEPATAGTLVNDVPSSGCTGQDLEDDNDYYFHVTGTPAGANVQWVYSWARRAYAADGSVSGPVWQVDTSDQSPLDLQVLSKDIIRLPGYYDPQYEVAAFVCYPVKLTVTQDVGSSKTTKSVAYDPNKTEKPFFDFVQTPCPIGGAEVGTTITLKAGAPPVGYDLVGFTGDGVKSADGKSVTVLVDKPVSIGLEYRVKCYTLSLDNVSKFSPAGNCPDGSSKYIGGTVVSVKADDRGSDYVFRGWNGPVAGATLSSIVTVDKDMSVSPDYYHKDLADKANEFFTSTLPDVSADIGKKLIGALAATAQVAMQFEYGIVYTVGATLSAIGSYGHYLGIPKNVTDGFAAAGDGVTQTANYLTVAATCLEEWAWNSPAASAITQDVFGMMKAVQSPKNQYLNYYKRTKQVVQNVVAPAGKIIYDAANGGGLDSVGANLQAQADSALKPLDDLKQLAQDTVVPGSISAAQNFDADQFGLTMVQCVANHAPDYLKNAVGTP